MDLGGRGGGGDDLGGVRGGRTIIRAYHMKKNLFSVTKRKTIRSIMYSAEKLI